MYKRKTPPFILRCVMGGFMAFFKFVIMVLEKLGLTVRIIQRMTAQAPRRIVTKNPFKNYTPTGHDVFVATYVKSGTNWMMQIAHQLVNHGRGKFEHIHCVVPWPDTKMMGGGMRGYAVPIEDDSIWKASPEQ